MNNIVNKLAKALDWYVAKLVEAERNNPTGSDSLELSWMDKHNADIVAIKMLKGE